MGSYLWRVGGELPFTGTNNGVYDILGETDHMGFGVKKPRFLLVSNLPSLHECPLLTRKMRTILQK